MAVDHQMRVMMIERELGEGVVWIIRASVSSVLRILILGDMGLIIGLFMS